MREPLPLLVVDKLSVHLPCGDRIVRAIDEVSFTLQRGQTLALVGESGSGKSMLCRAIMGLVPGRALLPAPGRIVFAGQDLGALKASERAGLCGRRIGMVLQDPLSALNPVMKIGRQIAEPMRHHLGMSRDQARERSFELLRAVGIAQAETRIDCYPHQLSGGMRQRVVIAIALACEPQLLIADEPTTALDVTVQADILDLLARLQQERNMAMILVSHNLGVVAGRAHETAVMYAGRIVEQAPTDELFARMRMRYTRALFDAIPRLDDPAQAMLTAIGGQSPDLAALPDGCSFAPRCARAEARCSDQAPTLVSDGHARHRYACWFPCAVGANT
ncbi:MAG: peptide/nickel transport system ATP-binding protein [Rhodocyclaceae bacterium]|nr:MAG: peptide/nickel transport system ATP-binding protein [Rhodocyclaceae bacterium]TND02330.1 MAG: peptide/nickel transport system ATP-binding protein [Rhodocyclaceae bacterium]